MCTMQKCMITSGFLASISRPYANSKPHNKLSFYQHNYPDLYNILNFSFSLHKKLPSTGGIAGTLMINFPYIKKK